MEAQFCPDETQPRAHLCSFRQHLHLLHSLGYLKNYLLMLLQCFKKKISSVSSFHPGPGSNKVYSQKWRWHINKNYDYVMPYFSREVYYRIYLYFFLFIYYIYIYTYIYIYIYILFSQCTARASSYPCMYTLQLHFSPTFCSVATWVSRQSSQCYSAGSPCKSIPSCVW